LRGLVCINRQQILPILTAKKGKVMVGAYLQYKAIRFVFFGCLCVGWAHFSSQAQQQSFNQQKLAEATEYSYTWQDSNAQTQSLKFSLPSIQLNQPLQRKFVANMAQQYVYIELHKAARAIDPRQASVDIKRQGKNIQVEVTSRSQELANRWQKTMEKSQTQAFDRYLYEHYFTRFTSFMGEEAVKPDHLRYIDENKIPLLPVAQSIYDMLPIGSESRAYVNLLLSWVQSIPYNNLENRLTSNGAGYLPPLAVITNNQGDCDSKAVLMASLIRSLLPEVKMVLVYLPNHAVLGISLPFRNNEPIVRLGGTDYLLMETSGPAVMTIGETGEATKVALARGRYIFESIP
jgi:hypothetical protein